MIIFRQKTAISSVIIAHTLLISFDLLPKHDGSVSCDSAVVYNVRPHPKQYIFWCHSHETKTITEHTKEPCSNKTHEERRSTNTRERLKPWPPSQHTTGCTFFGGGGGNFRGRKRNEIQTWKSHGPTWRMEKNKHKRLTRVELCPPPWHTQKKHFCLFLSSFRGRRRNRKKERGKKWMSHQNSSWIKNWGSVSG